jgi:hypothetical protein
MGYFADFDAHDALTPVQRRLLDGITALLEELQPNYVDPAATHAAASGNELELVIPHRLDPATRIEVEASDSRGYRSITVYVAPAHEHFDWAPVAESDAEGVADAVSFVRALLLGQCEIRVTWRGEMPAKVQLFRIDGEERSWISTTGLLLFNPFRAKRIETRRISFVD